MAHVYYKDAAGCLIAFDVSESSSLLNGVVKWKHEFDKKVNYDKDNSIPCLLIGNKVNIFFKLIK
jgi:GTPase SAR1 family protein